MTANVTKKPAYFGILEAFTGSASNSSSTPTIPANSTVSMAALKASKSGAAAVTQAGAGIIVAALFAAAMLM